MIWCFVFGSDDLPIFLRRKVVLVPHLICLSRELICVLDKPVNNKIRYSNWLNTRVLKSFSRVVEGMLLVIWCKVWIEVAMFLSVALICYWNEISQSMLIPKFFIDLLAWVVSSSLVDIFNFPDLACLLNNTTSVFCKFCEWCSSLFTQKLQSCNIRWRISQKKPFYWFTINAHVWREHIICSAPVVQQTYVAKNALQKSTSVFARYLLDLLLHQT